jgi:hypothetical protein
MKMDSLQLEHSTINLYLINYGQNAYFWTF